MTFTLVSHLREQLSEFVRSRAEKTRREESERERLLIEVSDHFYHGFHSLRWRLQAEEAKTRGTVVTPESFLAWKVKFDKEMAAKRLKEQEEKLKGLSPKEREEYKKLQTRSTGLRSTISTDLRVDDFPGRQLFERRDWDVSEDSLLEEEGTSVDVSQYDRTREEEEEDNEDRVQFSDSD